MTIDEAEGVPAAYPPTDPVTDEDGETVDADMVWQRLEGWIAHRWRSRSVVYVIEGPGQWRARLTPFTATTVEMWQGDAWAASTPRPSPLGGYIFDGAGPYRVTGTAGDASTPPAIVLTAHRRLAEYVAQTGGVGFQSESDGDYSYSRNPAWLARAMHYSGAADLLRPYRRLGC